MTHRTVVEKLLARTHPALPGIVGVIILAGLYAVPWKLNQWTDREAQYQKELQGIVDRITSAHEVLASHDALKALDLEQLKSGIAGSALSQKSLFESGLSLQEERRLLEKQLEIMTTTLLINPSLQRIFHMRGEQPMQSYLLRYIPIKAYNGAPTTLPAAVRIVSKERFAHPERGKSEEVNGILQWVPPQVGSSVRSNALGEFVMFTSSALILHGPPVRDEDHERFPHICLGLERDAAQRLYRSSFIGTKVMLSGITIEPVTSTESAIPVLPSPNPT